jgi:hypothetical protein
MTSFKLLERIEPYYLYLSRIYKVTRRKQQSLQKYNIAYLGTTCLSLNRFFYLTTAKIVSELRNQASKKTVSYNMEGLEW